MKALCELLDYSPFGRLNWLVFALLQAVSILIAYAELGDWSAALNRVLPARKGVGDTTEEEEGPLEDNVLLRA